MKIKILILLFFSNSIQAQTLETIIKGGELLVTGISIFKTTKLTESKEKVIVISGSTAVICPSCGYVAATYVGVIALGCAGGCVGH